MIKIIDKELCCGCSACLHICPKHSITFKEDKEGFLYPHVNTETCIDCGLCERVCPVLNQNEERIPEKVYAAKHEDDEIRMKSSSGGIFTLLADQIIDEGGVVFGARFNDKWEVIHDYTETKEGLAPFRGSKYVQSYIGDSYKIAETFLKSGRKVMFTGTPCQIAGLKKFLRKEYDNLLAVDFVCHGVPSPMVWHKYLKEEVTRQSGAVLTGVNFRNKSTGWKTFSLVMDFTEDINGSLKKYTLSTIFTDNVYMNAFLSNLSLRPSCYNCPAKSGKSGADISIGDFWGIEKIDSSYYDDLGASFVAINKSSFSLDIHKCNAITKSYREAVRYNPAILSPVNCHPMRNVFMRLSTTLGVTKAYQLCTSSNIICRTLRKIYQSK